MIYLRTGFCPRGWNTPQPSFDFNPDVITREPEAVLAAMHARHVKVVRHMVPWDRDRLPTLHGSIPAKTGGTVDGSHIQTYWSQHVGLVEAGVDGFWPDEGDWFNLFERMAGRSTCACRGAGAPATWARASTTTQTDRFRRTIPAMCSSRS